jgi:hypothetical protein
VIKLLQSNPLAIADIALEHQQSMAMAEDVFYENAYPLVWLDALIAPQFRFVKTDAQGGCAKSDAI